MVKPKILGYIVCSPNGPREMSVPLDGTKPHGVLLGGDVVTVFATRARAKGAIVRSRRYARRHRLSWAEQPYQIWRLV